MFISNKLDSIAFGNIEGQLFHKQLKLEEKIKIVEQFYDPEGKSQDAGEDQHWSWRVAHDSTRGVQKNLKTQKKINIEEQLMIQQEEFRTQGRSTLKSIPFIQQGDSGYTKGQKRILRIQRNIQLGFHNFGFLILLFTNFNFFFRNIGNYNNCTFYQILASAYVR